MDEQNNAREQLLDEIDNGIYTTYWCINVCRDGSLRSIELSHVFDNTLGKTLSNFKPSDTYINRAKQQLSNMEWVYSGEDSSDICEKTAYCYLLKSNPDEPQCSNNLER
jgi:hypothetical protein